MIPEPQQAQIRRAFEERLQGRVRLDYFTQKPSPLTIPGRRECRWCGDVEQVLRDIAGLHPRLALTVHEFADAQREAQKLGVQRVPCTVIRGQANRVLRYYGLPGAALFQVLLEAIVLSSWADVPHQPDTVASLRRLRDSVQVSVLVSAFCEPSARVAHATTRMALVNNRVKAEVVEISDCPELRERYQVDATPVTVLDGHTVVRGEIDEVALAQTIVNAAAAKVATDTVVGPMTPYQPEPADAEQPSAAPRIYFPGQ